MRSCVNETLLTLTQITAHRPGLACFCPMTSRQVVRVTSLWPRTP